MKDVMDFLLKNGSSHVEILDTTVFCIHSTADLAPWCLVQVSRCALPGFVVSSKPRTLASEQEKSVRERRSCNVEP